MHTHSADLSNCTALVVEGNATMRSIMRAQLRDIGISSVVQVSRAEEARKVLEYRSFDFVLCELLFQGEPYSGQDLLDDLRRNQLLPFTTVFIIVTAEASYRLVSEAAESALDSFMLKPYAPTQLAKRLFQSRNRKNALKDIFQAMEEQRFEVAAELCIRRFKAREKYWLYTARLGAELLLRTGRVNEAQDMFRAIVNAKTLPWAKLGVARAQLEGGQISQATSTLEHLLVEAPEFADAYDVMGRAHFEQGKFSAALETYAMAAKLTPHSIGRLQNLAMVTYYAGSHEDAEPLLDRTVRTGLESKMFDAQVLVLLAFARLETSDRTGLLRCRDDMLRLIDKDPDKPRLQRLYTTINTLCQIVQGQFAQCVASVREQCGHIHASDFDFEAASNFLALLSQLTNKAIVLDEIDKVVENIGLRFCSNRALTELMRANAQAHPPFAEQMRQSQAKVVQYSEAALRMSLSGNPTEAVQELLRRGKETCNARLIDNAHQVLQKHAAKITDAPALEEQVAQLRTLFAVNNARPSLGNPTTRASGLALDHFTKPPAR